MTIKDARMSACLQLQNAPNVSATPNLDVDCLLAHILHKNRSWLFAHSDKELTHENEIAFFLTLKKRIEGIPIAYITNKKEFFGYNFFVTPDVLIPKPDTELLVEHSILQVQGLLTTSLQISSTCGKLVENISKSIHIADVCTGSGCIAISVLKSLFENSLYKKFLPQVTCDASDISAPALSIARQNADMLLPDYIRKNLCFLEGNLLEGFSRNRYDLIMSNPPYIPTNTVDELLKDGRSEPRLALDGDFAENEAIMLSHNKKKLTDGLGIIRRLIPQAWNSLVDGGIFLLETGEYNATKTAQLMEQIGFSDIVTYKDLGGQPRLTYGKKNLISNF